MPAVTTWTREMKSELRRLVRSGQLRMVDIAAVLNEVYGVRLTNNAIAGKMHRLGLSLTHKPPKPYRPRRRTPKPRPPAPMPATVMTLAPHAPAPSLLPDIAQAPERTHDAPSWQESPIGEPAHPILGLTNSTCRWPLGSPAEPDFRFCLGPANNRAGQPYCEEHTARAYR